MKSDKERMRQKIIDYVKKKYKADPEHLWKSYPDYIVFRHSDNNKWFGVIMDVPREKLGLEGDDRVDVLDVKVGDAFLRDVLLKQPGYMPGYHMNKRGWISVLLDGTVSYEDVCGMIDEGYMATASKSKREKFRPPKEWIIPANPKYYDIEHAFDNEDEINWKQGSGIKAGDTVFMYVAAPVSAILYKCKVTETDIPYKYSDENLTIKALMKIKLLKRYKPDKFTFDVLKDEYGIYAIRGPRGITNSLSEALK
ncbi:MAG: MmcQ/YjbR family DNA-binding protein [Lachnospiraceae bacterium]|nr:MmcQ/YjbR family DNA-binding protein [Lachnospiraceae bacterium]